MNSALLFLTILFFILSIWFGLRCFVLSVENDRKEKTLEKQNHFLQKYKVDNANLRKKVNGYKRTRKFSKN